MTVLENAANHLGMLQEVLRSLRGELLPHEFGSSPSSLREALGKLTTESFGDHPDRGALLASASLLLRLNDRDLQQLSVQVLEGCTST